MIDDSLERFDRLGFEALDEEEKQLVMDEENGGFRGFALRGLATRPIFRLRDAVLYQLYFADYGRADKHSPEISLDERLTALTKAMQLMLDMLVKFGQLPYRHTTYRKVQLEQFERLYDWVVYIRDKLENLKAEQNKG